MMVGSEKKNRNIVKGVLKTLICIYGCFVLVIEKDRCIIWKKLKPYYIQQELEKAHNTKT